MPDGLLGGGGADLWRSRILGSALEDTPYPQQQIGGMMSGMQPEQLAAFFQSPEIQKQFQSFGIDPQAMLAHTRQSPFLPNQFMQQHPLMGGFLNRSMANMAATPEAPLVSGAGSGLTRFAQGAYGGPEMLRHYQLQQMMAPMGALGGMMPTFGEQRRRAIEEAIVEETKKRMGMLPQQQQMQGELLDVKRMLAEAQQAKAEAAQDTAQRPQVHFGPIGTGIETIQHEPYQPAGGAQGVNLQQTGQGHPLMPISGPMAGQQQQMPGYGLTPEQQEGWAKEYTPYDQAALEGQMAAKARGLQTPEKAGLLKAQTKEAEGKAAEAQAKGRAAEILAKRKGERPEDYQKWSKQFNDERDKWAARDQHINEQEAAGGYTPEAAKKMREANDANFEQAKQQIDRARGAAGGPGASTPWQRGQTPPQVSPGASPGGAQAGGPGAQTSQGTATAPQGSGLPPGYHFNAQGIPVPDQQAAPQQAPRP